MPGTFSLPPISKETASYRSRHASRHVPWCISGWLTRGGGENGSGIPDTSATCNFTYLVRGPWLVGCWRQVITNEDFSSITTLEIDINEKLSKLPIFVDQKLNSNLSSVIVSPYCLRGDESPIWSICIKQIDAFTWRVYIVFLQLHSSVETNVKHIYSKANSSCVCGKTQWQWCGQISVFTYIINFLSRVSIHDRPPFEII